MPAQYCWGVNAPASRIARPYVRDSMAAEPLPTTLLSDRMPAWWRPFTVELEREPLARVRDGIEALRHELSIENAVDAVAYAFGDEGAGTRIIDTVRSAIATKRNGYSPAVGDAEPPALVAAALADQLAVAPDSDLATLISLLVLSADYGEREPAIEGMRLADYAARQLEHRSASARQLVLVSTDPPASALVSEALRALEPFPEYGSTQPGAPTSLDDVLSALAARVDEIAARIDAEHAILREQLRQQDVDLADVVRGCADGLERGSARGAADHRRDRARAAYARDGAGDRRRCPARERPRHGRRRPRSDARPASRGCRRRSPHRGQPEARSR